MSVEIREITIGAEIAERDPAEPDPSFDLEELRERIMAECEAMIRKAFERLGER